MEDIEFDGETFSKDELHPRNVKKLKTELMRSYKAHRHIQGRALSGSGPDAARSEFKRAEIARKEARLRALTKLLAGGAQ